MLGWLLLAGAVGLFFWNKRSVISAHEFFRPDLVQQIAEKFPPSEDDFILAAWNYVANAYIYEPIGSDMVFVNGQILCEDCYLPAQSLERDRGNCVAKSSLLVSLLATRIPVERLHIIIGSYGSDRELGGHSWAEVNRYGNWYLLESTKAPGSNPWVKADDVFPLYDPGVLISFDRVLCADDYYCSSFASCNCHKETLR